MQKYTTKQLLEILEDENFEYNFHDCLVGNPNRHLALQQLKDLNENFNLVVTTENEYPLNKIINTFVRTYDNPVTSDFNDRIGRRFEMVNGSRTTYKDYTVKDIRVLIEETKANFSTESYNNTINFLDRITKNKDENFYIEYATQRLDYEDTKIHMIKDFINKYLQRYYAWLSYYKNWDLESEEHPTGLVDKEGVDEGKYDVEEFKNEFEIYLLV